ncbi:MAG: polymerase subunit delta [Actinomycetota bacterium]|jgi:DNA polymerase-3 subunit delta'|nr:polymerase subunit delta [Actinomycetota bacterium]
MTVWAPLEASRVVTGLARQIAAGEIAHAWLLLGPAGSGKRPTSVAMAAAMLCPEQPGVGCGRCSTCLRVLRQRHPDVHHIVPEGPLIPVDVIRESVIPEASRSPFEARMKVFVFEEAERMNPAAQNALLKTLEEPVADTVFILISDREEELLETISSRCRVVHMESVPEQRVIELLTRQGVSEEAALVAARVSQGDLERALMLATDGGSADRRRLWLSIPRKLSSPVDALDAATEILEETKIGVKALEFAQKAEAQELADILGERRGTAAARNALAKKHKREQRRREEELLGEALETIASFYRDVLALRSGGAEAILNIDTMSELEVWAGSDVDDLSLLRAAERCIDTRATFLNNANPTLAMEATLVEIGHLVPAVARVHG